MRPNSTRRRTSMLVTIAMTVASCIACLQPLPAAEIPIAVFIMKVDGSEVRRVGEVRGFTRHGAPRWSHDGKRLAFDARESEAPDAAFKFFVVNVDGTGLKEMGESGMPDWSPDDKQIAYFCRSKNLKWGTWVQNADGKGRNWLSPGFAPRWSPDGGQLAFVHDGDLMTIDLVEDTQRRLVDEHFEEIAGGFDWSPDGKRVAFVGKRAGKRELYIANTQGTDKGAKARLAGAIDGCVAWSPDGKRLAISWNGLIHILDPDNTQAPEPIAAQESQNLMPVWSPDGKWIAFSSNRKTPTLAPAVAAVRRAITLEELQRHPRGSIVYSLAFAPDGRRAVLGGDPQRRGLQIWDIAGGDVKTHPFSAVFLALSPDGKTVAAAGVGPKIQLIDVETGELVRDIHVGDLTGSLQFSPDGTRLINASLNKTATVWDVKTSKELCVFRKHDQWVNHVAFMPDGKEAVSVAHDKTLRVWDAKTAQQRLEIPHPEIIWGLAITPDARRIVTGTGGALSKNPAQLRLEPSDDNVIRVWDSANGKLIREMKGHTHAVFSLDVSADGRLLVSGGWDNFVRLWDMETGEELASVEGEGSAMCVAFSPDATQLLVGGGALRAPNAVTRQFPNEQIRLYRIVEVTRGKAP